MPRGFAATRSTPLPEGSRRRAPSGLGPPVMTAGDGIRGRRCCGAALFVASSSWKSRRFARPVCDLPRASAPTRQGVASRRAAASAIAAAPRNLRPNRSR